MSLKDSLGTDMEMPDDLPGRAVCPCQMISCRQRFTIDMSGLKGNMGDTAGEGTNTEMEFTDDGSEIPLQSVQCHF